MTLDGITTGHEKHFDWPSFEGKPQTYILASVPRSGSTYLSHHLWRTGCLGAPLEYLNFEPTGPLGAASNSPEAQIESWHRTVSSRTSPNGVFGVKAFPLQMEELGRKNPKLLSMVMRFLLSKGAGTRVVQLRRKDKAAHAISLARASVSGIWRAEQEKKNPEEIPYSTSLVQRAEHELSVQEQAWRQMYRETGVTPLVVWYEDVVENADQVIRQVADYLGVALDPAMTVAIPEIRQQDQTDARQWKARYLSGECGASPSADLL